MMRDAMTQGAKTAIVRFNVREASSVLETVLGALGAGVGGAVARGALNAASPKILPALENFGAAPVNAVRRMISPARTPADLLVRHLAKAKLPPLPPTGGLL